MTAGINGFGAPPDKMVALKVSADGTAVLLYIETDVLTMRDLVDGPVVAVVPCEGAVPSWRAYTGTLPTPPSSDQYNLAATTLAKGAGWLTENVLYGTVVFVGDAHDGTDSDVPSALVELGRRAQLWTEPPE